jgi:hypothetical protein
MKNPTINGLSESQYDSYLLNVRGLSRSTRNLHYHVVHRFFSSRFASGCINWSEVRFNDFVQFLTREFGRLQNRGTQTAWLMVPRSAYSGRSRSAFRGNVDHDSGLKPIRVPG